MTYIVQDLTEIKIALGIAIAFVALFGSFALFNMISKKSKYTLNEEDKNEIWNKICLSLDELDRIENDKYKDKSE